MEGKQIIAVTNRNLCTRPFLQVMEELAQKELKTIVLREKDLPEKEYEKLAGRCLEICQKTGADLTIHNFISAARNLGVKKIHLPYSVFLKEADTLGDFDSVSTSIHKPDEVLHAQELGADFVFAGHIFETDCKKGLAPRGLDFLKKVLENARIPVYGIGGIHENNYQQVLDAGAAGICMMSEFMK